MNDIIYQLKHVQQVYNNRRVLHIPQMQIQAGEALAIVGPSGAGKSTLLRILAMLEKPTHGDAIFYHSNNAHQKQHIPMDVSRQIAMVFQRPALMSRNVHANVAYGLRVRGKYDDALVMNALERVSMAHLADARPHTLSGGEMQRVSLARAIVLQPRVLLLDEPTANLDPANVRIIEAILREQNEKYATTIIMVTHNILQAKRIAHRVAFIYESNIVEITDTAQFFDNPQDPRTRAFISGDLIW